MAIMRMGLRYFVTVKRFHGGSNMIFLMESLKGCPEENNIHKKTEY